MKKLFYLVYFLFTYGIGGAQNLVPNPSFEFYTICPNSTNQLSNAYPWYNPTGLSPDYFNACVTSTSISVPVNFGGVQYALTGNAYAGVFASQLSSAPDIREYIRVQLIQPLQTGISYRVKFNISLTDNSDYAVSSFGAYLAETDTTPMIGYIMNVIPQIQSDTTIPLIDKVNWMPIEGTFTANGNEQYLTIGNFNNESSCGLYSFNGAYNMSFYFIEDVSVLPDSLTGVDQNNFVNAMEIYPNPFNDKLFIENTGKETAEIYLYDIVGRNVLKMEFTNTVSLNTEQLVKGIYIYELRNKNGSFRNGKLVKD